MSGSAPTKSRGFSATEFFALARTRLSLDVPDWLADPHVIPWIEDADPTMMAAIAAIGPMRAAAVLVPVVARAEPTVLLTQRTVHLADHAGQIAFPGGKIDSDDASPAAAALREAEEEIALDRSFVEPIGYLNAYITPSGFRILPTIARVSEGFSLQFRGEVNHAFEVPLSFLMTPRNHTRQKADWNGLVTTVYAIRFNDRNIWGVTAAILRNLWERIYAD
jgi:8-oxo-dGTP pyrophosphatase MutT (NUDIX family)